MEHFGVEPDIMALAKGIASGLPLGAMVARRNHELGSGFARFHLRRQSTRMSCSSATIELIEESLMANAAARGEQLMNGLREMQKSIECLGDVRGKGLMVGVELVKDRVTKERASRWRNEVIRKAFTRGLLLLGCGDNTIRFCPALTVSAEEVDVGLDMFEESVRSVAG